jgi:sigma-B regulation protein RsbU (phosphoserine phosphatase)
MENKKLILVVDDDPRNIRLAKSILETEYQILSANTGQVALSQLLTDPLPDLILLDVNMPEINGFEICRQLKANLRTREIPVIFLTGQIEDKDELEGFNVGAVDYIHKPFSQSVMQVRVKTHIQLREARQQLSQQLIAIGAELEMAREIQLSILPRETPRMAGLDIAARYFPMSAVAGDFYDFILVDEKHLGILIADVSGHGLPAALIASMLKIAFSAQSKHAHDPAEVLHGLNQALHGKFQLHYVTAAYLFFDLEKNVVRYGGAGHPPLLLCSHDPAIAREFKENGLFLGPFAEATYTSIQLPLAGGDRLLLYTDAILEFKNLEGDEFEGKRLSQFLQANHMLDANRFAEALLTYLWEWAGQSPGAPQSDDLTLIVIDIKPR